MAIFCSPGPEFYAASDGSENPGNFASLVPPGFYRAARRPLYH